jgi:hypothetical protein
MCVCQQPDREQLQAIRSAAPDTCPLCKRVDLKPESTGLAVQWKVDLARLEWTVKHVTPACLHCCTASSADAMLNAALSVSDAAGEAALQGVTAHVLVANGHAPEKGELVQAALNLGHGIKVLAGNLPCRVVKGAVPLPAGSVPCLCVEMLEASMCMGGKGSKTPAKTASSKKRAAAVVAAPQSNAGGDSEEEEEPAVVKSAKKVKTAVTTPSESRTKGTVATGNDSDAASKRRAPGTPGKGGKTTVKTPQRGSAKKDPGGKTPGKVART